LTSKLKRILAFKAGGVLCTDPYVTTDPALLPLPEVIERSDLLVIATPHPEYRELTTAKPVADIWNTLGAGVQIGAASARGCRSSSPPTTRTSRSSRSWTGCSSRS